MDDDDEPMTGAVDPVRPWTIKAISAEVRDIAIMAARKDNVTVGQWLERRIREWTAAPSTAVTLSEGTPPTSPIRAEFEAAAQLVRLAIELAAASPEPAKTDPLLRTARGTVRALLTKLRPDG
jgi:hypothetical protein